MSKAEERLDEHDTALRGTYDGSQTGLVAAVAQLLEVSRSNAAQLEALRLDKQKVLGIILGVTALLGLFYKFFLK